jgi:OmpA-OmpF porin, OOP family
MKTFIKAAAVLILFSMAVSAEAQIKVDLKKKLEQQVNRRLNQKADQAIDKALDTVEDSLTPDKKNGGNTNTNGTDQKSGTGQAQGKDGQDAGAAGGSQQQASLQAYSKYDFIPGEKVIFYEDFSQDAVGDFPALWNTNGSAEVVTTNLYPG